MPYLHVNLSRPLSASICICCFCLLKVVLKVNAYCGHARAGYRDIALYTATFIENCSAVQASLIRQIRTKPETCGTSTRKRAFKRTAPAVAVSVRFPISSARGGTLPGQCFLNRLTVTVWPPSPLSLRPGAFVRTR